MSASDQASQLLETKDTEQSLSDAGTLRILIVDHHPADTAILEHYLQQLKCSYVVASNCDEALLLATKSIYDVALVDIRMPGLEKFHLADQIRAHEKAIGVPASKIIAMSASAHIGNQHRPAELGMDDYMPKPCNPKLLAQKLGLKATNSQSQ